MTQITHKRSIQLFLHDENFTKSLKPFNLDMNEDRARTCVQHDSYFKMVLENDNTIIYGPGYKLWCILLVM